MKKTARLTTVIGCLFAATSALAEDASRFEYSFDTSGAPELAEWMNVKLVPVVREWYPKLVDMFPSEGWTPYASLKFKFEEGLDCPAYTSGATVAFDRKWFKENPEDIGCAVHELFHVVQKDYPDAPDWLTEGIADYVRFYLFEPESKGCEMDVKAENVRYDGSYRVSANFLNFVETRHPGLVKDLNAICRQGKYDENSYWTNRTGKTVKQLEREWKDLAPESGAVPFRGVVEGFYGRPWGTEGRLSLLKFMGANGLNVFIYGPKDDPYHHDKWCEPYPEGEMRDFKRILEVAKENKVAFYWAIHLGGSFKNGNEEDYAALFRKLGLMYDAGFRAFAVFFDDFGEADAKLHSEICNRVVAGFLEKRGDCSPLIMCPNVYCGWGHDYQKTLGELLDRRAHILWTGQWIMSDIRAEYVEKIAKDLKRPPFVWWNWPVNDYCRSSLLLGRTYGLEKCKLAGIVSNPMENCEANKIALYSFAKWCTDPGAFDSRKCWEESFGKLYNDPVIARAMRVFAEHNSNPGPGGRYTREESASCAALCEKAKGELDKEGRLSGSTESALRELFKEIHLAAKLLKIKLPKGRYDLGWEIEGWLDDEMHLIEQAAVALDLLKPASEPKDREADLGLLKRIREAAKKDAAAHCGKFSAATFEEDRRHVRRPKASPTVLRPLADKMVAVALGRIYKEKFGKPFDAQEGFAAFSAAKALEGLRVSREGRVAGIVRVMEPRDVAPGETFGLSVPRYWRTDCFHAELATPEAAAAGVIELSKDGKEWQKLGTRTKEGTGQMHSPLKPEDGWRFARYRNASEKPVSLKIDLFKFDVQGADSPTDFLLDEISK